MTIDDTIQILNSELSNVASWLYSNEFALNLNKTDVYVLSIKMPDSS